MQTEKFTVIGMSCAACSSRVERSVKSIKGVENVAVSLLTGSMQVTFSPPAAVDEIISAVVNAGYGAQLDRGEKLDLADHETPRLIKRLILSLIFLLPIMYLTMGHMISLPQIPWFSGPYGSLRYAAAQLLLTLPVVYINRAFFISGLRGLIKLSPGMDALVCLGSGAALVYGIAQIFGIIFALHRGDAEAALAARHDLYFESCAMILTLITVGKMLEAYSKGRTTDALRSLMKLAPHTAHVIRDDEEIEIPIDELAIDDIFVIRPGDSIPADAVVVSGRSSVNESALTGESLPVDKAPGDSVKTAAINLSGVLKCRAVQVGQDTSLAKIIRLVHDAAATKAPLAKTADRVSAFFVPIVIGLSILTLIIWLLIGREFSYSLARAISVMVISCPCALGLATPVAIMVGSGVGAKNGILFKSAAALESAGRVDIAVLDKTGTITQGRMHVASVYCTDGTEKAEFIRIAAAIEKNSEHPLAKAVLEYAQQEGVKARDVAEFEVAPGLGVHAVLDGNSVYAGNEFYISNCAVISENARNAAREMNSKGESTLFFVYSGQVLGVIGIRDTVKPESAAAIESLRRAQVRVVMLTGDNEKAAAAVGGEVGIEEKDIVSQVLPADKEAVVRALQSYGRVAMVGDGINDAPALTRADVGIAIGAGSDIAIDAAEIVLVKNTLSDVSAAVNLSRHVIRNIKQNLFWAFFYNAICIPLAAGVFTGLGITLNPMYAAAAMSLSSICVVSNALRLNFVRIYRQPHGSSGRNAVNAVDLRKLKYKYEINNIKGENKIMKKTMKIEGMMCIHCQNRVKKALEALGVKADVSFETGIATVEFDGNIADMTLKEAVEKEDYTVVSIV